MTRSVVTFKQFFLESMTIQEMNRLRNVRNILKTIPNKEDLSISQISEILSKKLSEIEGVPVLIQNQTIYTWLSQNSVPDWRKEENKHLLDHDHINKIINNITNRNRLTPSEMYDLLYTKYNIVMNYKYFRELIKNDNYPDWIPFNKLREVKNIIGHMRNRNDMGKREMLLILNSPHYNLNILRTSFNNWIDAGEFPSWTPKENNYSKAKTKWNNSNPLEDTIKVLSNIENPSSMKKSELLNILNSPPHSLGITRASLDSWIRSGKLPNWNP